MLRCMEQGLSVNILSLPQFINLKRIDMNTGSTPSYFKLQPYDSEALWWGYLLVSIFFWYYNVLILLVPILRVPHSI